MEDDTTGYIADDLALTPSLYKRTEAQRGEAASQGSQLLNNRDSSTPDFLTLTTTLKLEQ